MATDAVSVTSGPGFPHGSFDQSSVTDLIAEHAIDAIFLLDAEGRTTFANPAAEEMFGWSKAELLGKVLHEVLHYKQPDGTPLPVSECVLVHIFDSGQSVRRHEDTFFRRDGSPVPVACSIAAVMNGGTVAGGVLIVRDNSARRDAERRRQLLLRELQHRVKNMLAVVQSIAHQSLKTDDVESGLRSFDARLAALSKAHDLLIEREWSAAPVAAVVSQSAAPFCPIGPRLSLSGPEVMLPANAALALALAVHELATNAVKYGALSNGSGRVDLSWAADDGQLVLRWVESGGPAVVTPERQGFGTTMISHGLSAELNATVETIFRPEGLVCTISAPLPDLDD